MCMRPEATGVCGLKLLVYPGSAEHAVFVTVVNVHVYAALSYWCMRPETTSACGLKLLVYAV